MCVKDRAPMKRDLGVCATSLGTAARHSLFTLKNWTLTQQHGPGKLLIPLRLGRKASSQRLLFYQSESGL